MPSESIITMTPATSVANADLLPISQGGANLSATRAQMLRSTPGEDIEIISANAFVSVEDSGSILVSFGSGQQVEVRSSSTLAILLHVGQTFCQMTAPTAGFVALSSFGGQVEVNAVGHVICIDNSGASVFSTYISPSPSIWAGSAPSDMASAINRIAAAVRGLLGIPIP